MKKVLVISILAALTVGCSSKPAPESDMAKRLVELEQANKEMRDLRVAEEQVKLEKTLEVAPKWYIAPPAADGTGFYGVGYAKSKNLGHGLKAARLQAEFDLAKMYRQELSGSERAFERGDSEGNVQTQTTFLIDKIVDSVPVVGYTVVEQKINPVDGTYEAFVLLKLPFDEFNKVLKSEREKSFDKTVQSQYDDLERRLKDRREEKAASEQAIFDREQEALRNRADILKEASESKKTEANKAQVPAVVKTPVTLLNALM